MLFNTIEFFIFFIIVLALYWSLRGRLVLQNALLLGSSYLFYGWWDTRFLYLIVISTFVDYTAALMIDRGKLTVERRVKSSLFLILSALFFVTIPYSDLNTIQTGISFSQVWDKTMANELGLWVLASSIIVVIVFNLFYPVMEKWNESYRRKFFLATSIISNLSILGFFKYFNFFTDNMIVLSESLFGVTPGFWTLNVILPVGISFYTFQTMSYTIDVYRKEMNASKSLLEFGTYVSFFPQLVAGPIERGKQLLPQFQEVRPSLNWDIWRGAVWLIVWGLFKKVVIADNLSGVVNDTFGPYDSLSHGGEVPQDGLRLLFGIYAFALQIYCDFSGYTDIARGVAKLLGFNLMLNFKLPYFATSPSSFWRQWHISLSTWLRDYLYIPLGGNRGGTLRNYRNLFLTMLLGGLWHGASWTFVIWGAYHGLLLIAYRLSGLRTEKGAYSWWVMGILGIIMFHFTCMGWLIFRAQNVTTIGVFLESIFLSPLGSPEAYENLKTIIYYSWFLITFQVVQAVTNNLDPMKNWHWFVRLNVWTYVIMSLLVLSNTQKQEFIYFAF